MPELVREMLPALKDNSIITDVGSTKVFPAHEIGEILRDTSSTFIGSHPLTGSEQSGTKAARLGLYRNATVFVTTTPDTPTPACRRVATFWKHIGSHVIILSASEHDQMMARTSHLPHLAAATLVKTATRDTRNITQFCGPGIRDTTRIAEGPEQVWHDITKTNRDAILQELRAFSENIGNLITMLENNNFEAIKQLLADSRKIRSSWNPKHSDSR
jgi:prephenate dehydrogenase